MPLERFDPLVQPRASSLYFEYRAEHGVRPVFANDSASAVPDVDIQGRILGGVEIAHLAVGVHASVDESDEVLALIAEGVARERSFGP